MPDTSKKHDPKLGVELMRRYCDPRRDFGLGLRRPRQSTSPVPAMQPDQRSLHSPPGRTFRRYLRLLFGAGRPHDRRPCWRSMQGGLVRSAGRCMHWEAYSECSYVQLDPFARFSAAQGASSPRVRARQTSIATLRAQEHARASDMPSLSQAPCKRMRG